MSVGPNIPVRRLRRQRASRAFVWGHIT